MAVRLKSDRIRSFLNQARLLQRAVSDTTLCSFAPDFRQGSPCAVCTHNASPTISFQE